MNRHPMSWLAFSPNLSAPGGDNLLDQAQLDARASQAVDGRMIVLEIFVKKLRQQPIFNPDPIILHHQVRSVVFHPIHPN